MTQNAVGETIAQYSDYEPNLVELYTRFRYNELTCHKLMGRAARLEKAVRWSLLALLAISLLTGIYPGLNSPALNRIWGTVTAAATLLAVYSLFEGSGERQFHWFRLAARFRSSANEVEFFSFYVKRGRILEVDLDERWKAFRADLDHLLEHAGLGLTEYESKHRRVLTIEIRETLKQEKR
jgi:hypothetical protein